MTTYQNQTTDSGSSDPRIGPLVLVAEDDAVQRIALTRMLEADGFDVIATENGAGAIALADAHHPDLMLIDAVMPQIGGFEAIGAIRTRPGLETTPTIVLSGLEDLDSRLNALAMGADDFVTKPVDRAELLARIRAQLRNVDAWYGRVNTMISSYRTIRRRISEAERLTTPVEAVRSLLDQFPEQLHCRTLVTVDAEGSWEYASEPFYPEDLSDLPLADIPAGRFARLRTNDSGTCPLCGAATGSTLIATEAGSWRTGRAVLLIGCTDGAATDLEVLAHEVADACGLVLTERMRDWESDLELVRWLDDVLEQRAFQIAYQPIVDMRTGRVSAHEALARFDDGTSPGEAFRIAVSLGRREELELELVRRALEQAVALPDGVRVHVNVSPGTALLPELADLVQDAERRVVLEITEHALFTSAGADTLRNSIPASCLLAADDVGAGYAGLSQLLEYRPEVIKIDRAVVKGIDTDPARQALVAGLVQFAQTTRSFVVGEGIERDEEWRTLRHLGVDFGQGYFFARPIPLAEAAQMSHWTRTSEPASSKRRSLRHRISG